MSLPQEVSFNYSPIPELVVNPFSDEVVSGNLALCKFLQMDLIEIVNLRVSRLFSATLGQLHVFSDEVLSCGSAWSDSLYLVVHDNEKRRVEVNAQCVKVDDVELIVLSLQDAEQLSKRRERAEAQRHYRSGLSHWNRVSKVFQEFEKENHLILQAAGEGIYGVDTEGRTTFINPAAENILEYELAELLGKRIHHIIHHTHGDGSEYAAKECPIYQAFRDGIVRKIENEIFWSKSGKPIDVEYTSTPIRDNGHLVGAVVIFRDVTEKNRDRERLLGALEEVKQLQERLELENAYLQEEISSEYNHQQIIGKSPAIQQVIQKIELVAPTDATVLINGESGTGKELVARAIHDLSDRSRRSLIRVNCAAIPVDLFESEFFGHKKGAFTGAASDRVGRFELANQGTLFLDEVGEIPLQLQGKLLRVLQEQQFERVGDTVTRDVDVRIIAATNRDLKKLVDIGEFREDLYFRLNVFPIESVPLRDRMDDIPLLAQHFLQHIAKQTNKPIMKISLSQLEHLKRYHWPGNVRELENIIERQIILARNDELRFGDLLATKNTTIEAEINTSQEQVSAIPDVMSDEDIKRMEIKSIKTALEQCRGKVSGIGGAAELLNIPPTTLASRIKKYEINVKDY